MTFMVGRTVLAMQVRYPGGFLGSDGFGGCDERTRNLSEIAMDKMRVFRRWSGVVVHEARSQVQNTLYVLPGAMSL